MCKLCETRPVYEFTNKRKVCKNCFIKKKKKKFFYTVRKFKMIKKGDKISFKENNDFRSVVLINLLKNYKNKLCIKLVSKRGKMAVPVTIDGNAKIIVDALIKKDIKELNIGPVFKNLICPLYLFLDKEVELYANLKKLNYSKIDNKKNFLDKLEIKHPEIKWAIVSSYLKIFLK